MRRELLQSLIDLPCLQNLFSFYILFDLEKKLFIVLSKRQEEFAPQAQLDHLGYGKVAVTIEADVDN